MSLTDIKLDQQKKILIVIFFVLISYVDLTYILKSQKAGIVNLESKVKRLKNDLTTLNRGLESMRVAKVKQNLLTQNQAAKTTKILAEGQISGLLQDISKEANRFNIRIIKMNPSREVVKSGAANTTDKLTPLYINLDLICDYHDLGKFINILENYPVFMSVQELKIMTQAADYMKQKVTLMLKTYVTK